MLYAEGLRDRGHDIRLIVEPGSPIHEMAERQKLPVITLSMRRANYGGTIGSSKAQDYSKPLHLSPLNKNLFTRVLYRRLCNCDRRRADAKGVDRAGWD